MITLKNNPIEILNVEPFTCFILNIIKAEKSAINNKYIGYEISFKKI